MENSTKTFQQSLLKEENNLRNFAYSLTWDKNDAEDLLQETFLRAMLKRDTYSNKFKSWIFTVMRHIFYNNIRDKKVHAEDLEDETQDNTAINTTPGYTNTLDRIFKKDICNKIMALSDEKREAFLLLAEGYKYEEIAEKLNIPLSLVKSRIHETRKILIKQLETDEHYLKM